MGLGLVYSWFALLAYPPPSTALDLDCERSDPSSADVDHILGCILFWSFWASLVLRFISILHTISFLSLRFWVM